MICQLFSEPVNALPTPGIPQSNLSQHLSLMRQIGIVQTRRRGPNVCYTIADHQIVEACELVRKATGERVRRNGVAIAVTL